MDRETSKNICTVNEASMTKNTVKVEFFTRFCRLQVSVKLQCISQSILYLIYLSSNGTKFVIYGYHKMQLQTRTCIYFPFLKNAIVLCQFTFPFTTHVSQSDLHFWRLDFPVQNWRIDAD